MLPINQRPRIREIVREEPPSLERRLETRARRVAGRLARDLWSGSIESIVEREIALTLRQIENQRSAHAQNRMNLLRLECYVDTEYMAVNKRLGYYTHYLFLEREKLRKKLWEIESERRKLTLGELEKLQPLHERLLVLLNRHRQLQIAAE